MFICNSYANNKQTYDIKTATSADAHHAVLSREQVVSDDHFNL